MCGIAALLGYQNPDLAGVIRAMTDSIRHRGPDDEGFVFFDPHNAVPCAGEDTPPQTSSCPFPYTKLQNHPNATDYNGALGHRRLSILDLSPAAHQPMCDQNARLWISYNGEIYNHVELRQQLKTLGYHFHTTGDTEVLLAAWSAWGIGCLEKLNGMFAFVLVDLRSGQYFAVRDRFGVKPLYYKIAPSGYLAFASEIKQFTVLPDWRPVLNGQPAYDYLNWGLTHHTADTLFANVGSVRGGEYAAGSIQAPVETLAIKRWYDLRPQPFSGSYQEAVEIFANLLRNSVQIRMRSDVDVGSCLSGGLDSSTIVCLMNELRTKQGSDQKLRTFSACSHDLRFDERRFIEQVLDATGAIPTYLFPDVNELWTLLQKLVWHQDEPFGSTSIYAQWEVFRHAGESGIKVMLDGQGADEGLLGYLTYFDRFCSDLFFRGDWYKLFNEARAIHRFHGRNYGPGFFLRRALPQWSVEFLRKAAGRNLTQAWLNRDALAAVKTDPFAIQTENRRDATNLFSYHQLVRSNLPMLLHWEDRDSMAHSVESRTPFVDYRILEHLLSLPAEYKLGGGVTKWVLRDSMINVLPPGIRNRTDKMGFVTPEELWVKNHPALFRTRIERAVEESNGIIKQSVLTFFDEVIANQRPYDYFLWRVICFNAWRDRFSVTL